MALMALRDLGSHAIVPVAASLGSAVCQSRMLILTCGAKAERAAASLPSSSRQALITRAVPASTPGGATASGAQSPTGTLATRPASGAAPVLRRTPA